MFPILTKEVAISKWSPWKIILYISRDSNKNFKAKSNYPRDSYAIPTSFKELAILEWFPWKIILLILRDSNRNFKAKSNYPSD